MPVYGGGTTYTNRPMYTDVFTLTGTGTRTQQTNSFSFVPPKKVRQRSYFVLPAVVSVGPWNLTLGIVTETDTVIAFGKIKTLAITPVTETDTVLSFGRAKSRLLGMATESDLVLAFGRAKTKLLSIVSETDIAMPITRQGVAAAVSKVRTIVLNRFGYY